MAAVFRATRHLRAVTKQSTGLVGIVVDPNGRVNLIAAQKALLEAVKVMPAEVEYRKSVETLANFRLQKATEITNELELEAAIGMGAQLEELIIEAQDELHLVGIYAQEKVWERVPDLNWKASVEKDAADDIKREDAATGGKK